MKYIIKNLKSMLLKEPAVFVMIFLSIITSTTIIMFSIGFINHIEEKKKDEVTDNKLISIEVNDFTDFNFTKGEAIDILYDIDKNIKSNECAIQMCVVLKDDVYTDDPDIYFTGFLYLPLYFSIENGELTVPYDIDRWDDDANWWYGGRLFTEEDFDSGNLVCIARPANLIISTGSGKEENINKTIEKYTSDSEGYYYIGGKKYTCIGYSGGGLLPFVPITTVDDDSYVTEIIFAFNKAVSRRDYEVIYSSFTEKLGAKIRVSDIEFDSEAINKYYNTFFVIACVIAVIAGLIVSMLYEYILMQRRKNIVVMRLCGLSKNKTYFICYVECMLLFLVAFFISCIFYQFVILPLLLLEFEYISTAMNALLYVKVGGLFLFILSALVFVNIVRFTDKDIATSIKKI